MNQTDDDYLSLRCLCGNASPSLSKISSDTDLCVQ